MTNARNARTTARAERLAQVRRQQARGSRRRRVGISAAAALAVLILAVGVLAATRTHSAGGGPARAEVQSFTEQRNHVTGRVTYRQTPPAGGNHSSVWLNCGVYAIPVPNENAVHDLEHGAVWITYRPDLPKSEVVKLADFARGQTYLDLSPYPGLSAPVVVSAWGKQLRLTGASDTRLAAFVRKYKQGPQTPEPGAPCTGGVGTPNG